jgi:hypothetical protein
VTASRTAPRTLLLRRRLKIAAGLGVLTLGATVAAAPTATFKVSTFAELNKGEPDGTFISSRGEVLPGRSSTRLKGESAALFWTSVRSPDGTVYFGTGDEARLIAVKNNAVRVVADLKAVLVTALAIGPGGKILAATMPGAKLIEVDPGTGKWRQLASLPCKQIWGLLHDSRAGAIYVASGSPGKLFRLPAGGGAPEVWFDPSETHLLSIARERDGSILVGSSENAILYRVSGKGKGVAVHDFDASELRDIVVNSEGVIYVAVNKFDRRTSGLPRYDAAEDGEEGTTFKPAAPPAGKAAAKPKPKVRPQELRPGAKTGKGALFTIDPNGRVEELLSLATSYFTDLELDESETLWAGDGSQGKVYLAYQDRTVVTAFDFPERQVLTVAVQGKELYLGTGDAGAIYRISPAPDGTPAYLSQIFDAKFVSRWGNLKLQASEGIKLESRSGATAKPDKTWNGWRSAKGGAGLAQLQSPAGRYLQLRFKWQGKKMGVLRSFVAYYAPQNQRGRVSEVTVGSDGKALQHSSKLKVKWKTENPDSDTLVYRIYVREEMGSIWRLISGHDPLEKAEFEWETEAVPDGYYRLKVLASDERDNPQETALTDSEVSERVLVDNRKPDLTGVAVKAGWVSGIARDTQSIIKRIEYSIDGGPWRLAGANDGIYDSSAEGFRVKLPEGMNPGTHVLAVRAYDEADNIGVAQIRFLR